MLNANIEQPYDEFKQYVGSHIIVISRIKSNEIKMLEKDFDYTYLLTPPKIIIKACWTQGYFYTVGNVPLTEIEKNLDYGFFDCSFLKFKKETGEVLNHRPKILGTYGLGSFGSVAYDVTKELIINPELTE